MRARRRNLTGQPINRRLKEPGPAGKGMPRPQKKRSARFSGFIIGIILAGSTAAIAATVLDWPSISQAHLVYAGGGPKPPVLNIKAENNKHFLHVTIRPIFKNTGFKTGRVERVNVVSVGAAEPPEEIRITYLDRSGIGWLEEKEIRCEFLVVLESRALEPKRPLEFRIYFYGPRGHELYWEGVVIENIPTRSA